MHESARRPPIVSRVIAVEAGLLLLAWGAAWMLDRPLFGLIVFDWEGILAGLLATIPPCAAMVWSFGTTIPPFPRMRHDVERLVMPLFRGLSPWDMALIALFAGVGEEVFFRGLLQNGLAASLGLWPALLLVSALFGALHWITATYALLAGLLGLYLGGFMAVSGNLLVPILVHALYDFFALRYLASRGFPVAEGEGAGRGSGVSGPTVEPGGPGHGEDAAPGPPQSGPNS